MVAKLTLIWKKHDLNASYAVVGHINKDFLKISIDVISDAMPKASRL